MTDFVFTLSRTQAEQLFRVMLDQIIGLSDENAYITRKNEEYLSEVIQLREDCDALKERVHEAIEKFSCDEVKCDE